MATLHGRLEFILKKQSYIAGTGSRSFGSESRPQTIVFGQVSAKKNGIFVLKAEALR